MGFGGFILFCSCGLLKIDYYIIICKHIFSAFSASSSSSSEEVRKLYLLQFKCFDSPQSECGTSPQASQRERVDHTELLEPPAILALGCSSHPRHSDTSTPLHVSSENSWEALKPLLISQITLSFQSEVGTGTLG